MPRVVCVVCHEEGYTASPDHVRCECEGKLTILEERMKENEKKKRIEVERSRDESPAGIE